MERAFEELWYLRVAEVLVDEVQSSDESPDETERLEIEGRENLEIELMRFQS